MTPLSRRALLAAVTTGAAGAFAGCNGRSSRSPSPTPSAATAIAGHAVFVADGVPFPATDAVALVDDPTQADIAVFPSGGSAVGRAADALSDGTVTAIVGDDAQHTLMQSCAADDRSYGFARDSWNADTRIVAADPQADHLDTHLFVGGTLPGAVPWALHEVVSRAVGPCTAPYRSTVVPPGIAERATSIGAARIRGRNAVAGFDRWDRVRLARDTEPTAIVFDTAATIFTGDNRYRADQVRLVKEFEYQFEGSAPMAGSTEHLDIRDTTDPTEHVAEHRFDATSDQSRQAFTACQRCVATTSDRPESISYIANGRFRWREPRLLEDDVWHHHTPGQAVWYP